MMLQWGEKSKSRDGREMLSRYGQRIMVELVGLEAAPVVLSVMVGSLMSWTLDLEILRALGDFTGTGHSDGLVLGPSKGCALLGTQSCS